MDPVTAFRQALLIDRIAARFFEADNRFQPPKQIVNGVEIGALDPKVLMIWKYVVEQMGGKFNFGGATTYWRNKCHKEGLVLPPEYLEAGKGAEFGSFKIMAGDQIEEWVKERLKSAGLLDSARRTVAEWELEISHLQGVVKDAQERIEKHQAGLAEGNRVNQRQKWLAEAQRDLASAAKDLDAAQEALKDLREAAEKHVDAQAPVMSFEQQFQTLLNVAMNDMSRKEVLARAKAALAQFEQQMNAAGARTAGASDLVDSVVSGLSRLWQRVVGCFTAIRNWADDLFHSASRLEKLFDSIR
jgi:hypothetical protein